jgi:hypothetical protein
MFLVLSRRYGGAVLPGENRMSVSVDDSQARHLFRLSGIYLRAVKAVQFLRKGSSVLHIVFSGRLEGVEGAGVD